MNQKTSSRYNWFTTIRFTVGEVITILQILRHSKDFGQEMAPPEMVDGIINKIENHGRDD